MSVTVSKRITVPEHKAKIDVEVDVKEHEVEVDVEVDIDEFSDEELAEELVGRGFVVIEGEVCGDLQTLYDAFTSGRRTDARDILREIFYTHLGRIA